MFVVAIRGRPRLATIKRFDNLPSIALRSLEIVISIHDGLGARVSYGVSIVAIILGPLQLDRAWSNLEGGIKRVAPANIPGGFTFRRGVFIDHPIDPPASAETYTLHCNESL